MKGSLNPEKCREMAVEFRALAACMANSREKEAILAAAAKREKLAAMLENAYQVIGSDLSVTADD